MHVRTCSRSCGILKLRKFIFKVLGRLFENLHQRKFPAIWYMYAGGTVMGCYIKEYSDCAWKCKLRTCDASVVCSLKLYAFWFMSCVQWCMYTCECCICVWYTSEWYMYVYKWMMYVQVNDICMYTSEWCIVDDIHKAVGIQHIDNCLSIRKLKY